jgi:Tfp pilus assembly pilus retraction ATPase PilT
MRKLTKNIRDAYGKEVAYTKVLELVSDALGCQAGPLMNALKGAADKTDMPASQVSVAELGNPKVQSSLPRDLLPDLADLGVLSSFELDLMRKLGRQKTGLVLVTGFTGSGKTVFTQSLAKEWVRDTGGTAYMIEDVIEYPRAGGRHGEGMIIQNQVGRRSLKHALPMMRTYKPEYVIVGEHMYSDMRQQAPSRVSDFEVAMGLAKERLVVVSAIADTPTEFLEGVAREIAKDSGETSTAVFQMISRSLSAVISVKRTFDGRVPAFSAKLWEERVGRAFKGTYPPIS